MGIGDDALSAIQFQLSGLSDQEVNWARGMAKKYEGGHLGKGDAARHLALGYIAAKARFKSDDYWVNPMALIQMREAGFDTAENEMDRKNNLMGFKVYALAGDDRYEAEKVIDAMMKAATEANGPKTAKAAKEAVYLKNGTPGNNYY